MKRANIIRIHKNKHFCLYLDGGCGSWGWMTADLAAILTGPLFVVELQLLCCAAMVVSYGLGLLGGGLI